MIECKMNWVQRGKSTKKKSEIGKVCNTKKSATEKVCNMKLHLEKREAYTICSMTRVWHEKDTTYKEWNMKKNIFHEREKYGKSV